MRRFLVAVLLVLAASPLTAPFAVGNPLDLFGGEAAQVQAKKAPDDPTACVGAPVVAAVPTDLIRCDPSDRSAATPTLRRPQHLPLRL
jgi:hypothetical protein